VFYTYAYCDPSTMSTVLSEHSCLHLPFYVGMGKGDRFLAHLKDYESCKAKKSNPLKCAKIKHIIESGRKPIIVILSQFHQEQNARDHEIALISLIGTIATVDGVERRGPLTNLHKGGRGGAIPKTLAGKVALSQKLKGRVITAEHRRKISESKTGNTHHSVETRALISKRTAKALQENLTARNKISQTHRGKSKSPEHYEKLTNHLKAMNCDPLKIKQATETRIANGNHLHSDQTKRMIASSTKSAMTNPTVISKIKRASKKRWSNPDERKKIADKNARTFQLTNKQTGKTLIIKNLAQYCRENNTHHAKVYKEFDIVKLIASTP